MIQKTLLAERMEAADTKTQLDYACTKLISNKIILAYILKATLEEYADCDVGDIAEKYIEGDPIIAQRAVHQDSAKATHNVTDDGVDTMRDNGNSSIYGDNTVDKSIQEGSVVFDIRFRAIAPKGGGVITLILNVELQKNFHPGYPLIKRAVYYCARMISAQYGTEFTKSDYKEIKKVYSIWICFKPPKEYEHSIVKYQMAEQILQEKKILLEQGFGIEMTEKLDEEVEEMCNFSDVYMEEGLAKGMAQGMAQGLAKGLVDGEEKMARLISLLLSEGNNDALLQVLEDKVTREKYYRQYNI